MNGLWNNYEIKDVATPEAWTKNPKLVLDFYNERRKNVIDAKPNLGHLSLVKLEKKFNVQIITQNIDDLHERAGSKNILHLHGEILKAKEDEFSNELITIKGDIKYGDKGPNGLQLRPHVVWFGEAVPEMINAEKIIEKSDVLIIVGTSLNVYPAAGLVYSIPDSCYVYVVDPNEIEKTHLSVKNGIEFIKETATKGLPLLVEKLMKVL